MKRRINLTLAILSLLVPGLTPLLPKVSALASSAPSLYFSESSVTAASGNNFSLTLRMNTNGAAINAVNVVVHYPENQLNLVGLDKGGSSFDTFLPAAPTASGGKLNFSAASLGGGASSGDVLVGTLSFAAKADSGSADVSLDGSQAANNGAAIDVTTTGSQVSFSAAGTGTSAIVGVNGISVTNVSLNGAIIHWKTTVAATSSVDYGADSNYGLSAGSSALTTDHVVDLGSRFAGKSTVHFRVTSVDAAGNRQSSADQIFTTRGYAVRLQVVDKKAQPQTNVSLTVGDSKSVTTDKNGYVTVTNVGSGSQKVTINGKTQSITVKALSDPSAATTPQQFKLVAAPSAPIGTYVGIAAILLLMAILGVILHRLPPRTKVDEPEAKK